jgi:hypothetical protein
LRVHGCYPADVLGLRYTELKHDAVSPASASAFGTPAAGSRPTMTLLKVVWQRRTQYQDCCYRTAGPMPAATRWRRAGTLRAASVGLEGSEARPLMLLQQSAQFGVLCSQGGHRVIHAAIIVDREDVRQAMRAGRVRPPAACGRRVARDTPSVRRSPRPCALRLPSLCGLSSPAVACRAHSPSFVTQVAHKLVPPAGRLATLAGMRRIVLGGIAGVLLLAIGTRAADALRIGGPRLRCGCTEACWCKRRSLTVFRWVTPGRWHRLGLTAEEKQSLHS